MTCSYCQVWAATTRKQLNNRIRNTLMSPEPKPHPCSICGSTDWMLTEEFLPKVPKRTGWMRFRWFRILRAKLIGWILIRQYRGFEKEWEAEGIVPADEIARTRETINRFIDATVAEVEK